MKNDFTTGRADARYLLKMIIPAASGSLKWMKSRFIEFRRIEKNPPFLADAVSDGITDFFKELGYPVNRKI